MADRYRCAPASLERDEPMAGTASRVRRWVLVEQPGAWGPDALMESRLDPDLGASLVDLGRRHRARVVLIRHPSRTVTPSTRVYLGAVARSGGWLEQLDLATPAELLTLDWARLADHSPPGIGQPADGPVFLVCTNGRHDPCCADFGRPVVRALVEAGTPGVWECSHIGGDRFAGNLVALPSGVYLGRVEPERAAEMVAGLGAGRIPLDCYRGRSCDPPLVQVAEAWARRHTGVLELDGLPVTAVDWEGSDAATVTFTAPDGELRVRVARQRSEAANVLTCTAANPHRGWAYSARNIA